MLIYTIYCDGELLYDPRLPEYAVQKPTLQLEENMFGTLTFTLFPGHPMYGVPRLRLSDIHVYRNGTLIYRGRPANIKRMFQGGIQYTCEEQTAALNDYLYRPNGYKNIPRNILGHIMADYPWANPGMIKIRAGNASSVDEIAVADDSYPGLWDMMMNTLIDEYGGYMIPRYDGDTIYVDWLTEDDLPTCNQPIVFGRNMSDLVFEAEPDELFTVLIPLGADVKNRNRFVDEDLEVEEDEKVPITIEDVNDNKDYLESAQGIALYGRIERTERWEKIKNKTKLKNKGQAYLDEHAGYIARSFSISAVDLSYVYSDIDSLSFMTKVRVVSESHGVDQIYTIRRIDIPLGAPENTQFDFGDIKESMTDHVRSVNAKEASKINDIDNRLFVQENPT